MIKSKSKFRKEIASTKYNKENDNSYIVQSHSDVYYVWECVYFYNLCWCPFFKNHNEHNEKYIYEKILNKKVLFLIGDSHLEQWSFLIYPYTHRQGYTILFLYCNMESNVMQ